MDKSSWSVLLGALGILALGGCGGTDEAKVKQGGQTNGSGTGGGLDIGGELDIGGGTNGAGGSPRNPRFSEPIPPLSEFTSTEFGGYALGRELDFDEELGGTAEEGAGGQADSCGTVLVGVIRDFQASHPDFEYRVADDRGVVQDLIGADRKPVYAGHPEDGTQTTHGQESFDQWYRNVEGVNLPHLLFLNLVRNGNVHTFASDEFFPLNGAGFGNEGRPHNYHFTTELHTEFRYEGGESFRFIGDDDVWVFINDRLAIDLGGVHRAQEAVVDLDDEADRLGLVPGEIYPLDMFHAERHTSESNFRIDTTLEFVNCGGGIVVR